MLHAHFHNCVTLIIGDESWSYYKCSHNYFFYSSQSITLCVIFISVYYETFVILLLNLFLLTVADLLFIEFFAHCSVSLYEVSVLLMSDSSSWVCCLLWYFFRSRRHRTWLLTMIHQVKKLRRIHTHTLLTALFPGLPRLAGTRKVKPIWTLLKQETVSGTGIIWAICKSTSLQTDYHTSTPPLSFYRPDALPAAQPTISMHWRQQIKKDIY